MGKQGSLKNIAVFASGRGSNFYAIARQVKSRKLKVNLALLVCDNPAAGVLGIARKAKIKVALIERENFASKEEFEAKITSCLKENNIDLIVMAGFMRLLSAEFVASLKNKILNIHPALLPVFKGAHAIKDAFDYGVKVTGVTVHFVDELMDHGPVILQAAVPIKENDTMARLEDRIHKLEHRLYPQAIKLFAEGKLKIEGRKVRVG